MFARQREGGRRDGKSLSEYGLLTKAVPRLIDSGRGSARTEDAQGTPTQSHISPSIFEYTTIIRAPHQREPPGGRREGHPTLTVGPNLRFSFSNSWGKWLQKQTNCAFLLQSKNRAFGPAVRVGGGTAGMGPRPAALTARGLSARPMAPMPSQWLQRVPIPQNSRPAKGEVLPAPNPHTRAKSTNILTRSNLRIRSKLMMNDTG